MSDTFQIRVVIDRVTTIWRHIRQERLNDKVKRKIIILSCCFRLIAWFA